jgi:membrane protease YdiL (CAAX protease family)
MMATKRIIIFLAFAFGIPWAAALVIYLSGAVTENAVQAVGLANVFFIATPWLGNVASRLITREGWKNTGLWPKLKRGWRFYLGAWLLPFLATAVGAAAFYLLYPQSFDPNLTALQNLTGAAGATAGMSPWLIFSSVTMSILFISSPINAVASLGEEFGWRAYLLPKLVERLNGERRAALLTGVIHGVWHWPLMLMSASLLPDWTLLTLLVYLVFTTALSVLLSWAALRSGSVWPAALGHGVANAVSALPTFLLAGPAIALIGPDPTGLIGGAGFVLLGLVLLFSRGAFAGRGEAEPTRV